MNTEFNIQIQVDVSCNDENINDPISEFFIKQAYRSERLAKGLCRYWKNPNRRELDFEIIEPPTNSTNSTNLINNTDELVNENK